MTEQPEVDAPGILGYVAEKKQTPDDWFMEFAVEVPGVGWATALGNVTADNQWVTYQFEDAHAMREKMRDTYRNLRCSDIAERVRLVERRVTRSFGPWTECKPE